MLRKWEKLPVEMQVEQIRVYYDAIAAKRISIFVKRLLDIFLSLALLTLLSPAFLLLAVLIRLDSKGPIFFRQVRITQYGKKFRIFKFRTMYVDAESTGTQVTIKNDPRITKIGALIRKYRLDETPQLLNVIFGDMSLVGTRPEIPKYVRQYTAEMLATLLMPAGITSLASVLYKDEALMISEEGKADEVYIKAVLPEKMKYNLLEIKQFSILRDIKTMFMTVGVFFGMEYELKGNYSRE